MEENKRKQYAHLYEHHEVEDPQPREEKEKPIGPSGRNRHRPMVEKVCRRIAFSFLAMAVVLLLALNYFHLSRSAVSGSAGRSCRWTGRWKRKFSGIRT